MDRIERTIRVRELAELINKLSTCVYRRLDQLEETLEAETILASVREMVEPVKEDILKSVAQSEQWIDWVGRLDYGCSDQVLEALCKEGDCILVLTLHVSLLADGLARVIEQQG